MRGTTIAKALGALVAVSGCLAWLTGPGQALMTTPQATLTAGEAAAGDNLGLSVSPPIAVADSYSTNDVDGRRSSCPLPANRGRT